MWGEDAEQEIAKVAGYLVRIHRTGLEVALHDPTTTTVPHEKVDSKEAIRDELRHRPENATLYHFSPDTDTERHEMAVVAEDGRIYRAIVGAC